MANFCLFLHCMLLVFFTLDSIAVLALLVSYRGVLALSFF